MEPEASLSFRRTTLQMPASADGRTEDREMTMIWIDTAGGPLICAAYPVGLNWRGTQASSIDDTQSDYDRACEIADYVGVVSCASSCVLVFGDEPLQTTVVRLSDGNAVVRWISCASENAAQSVLASIPTALP